MDPSLDRKLASLMAAAQKGNKDAYESFLMEASVVLRAFISRRMNEADRVEDVLQDTLLSIHKARHTHIPGRPVGPWAYAICNNRIADFYRRHRRIERSEVLAPEDFLRHFFAPENPANHLGQLVTEALLRLSNRQRKVVELLKMQDLSVKEVAFQMDMTESAVKVTAHRAYQALRRILGAKRK